MIEVLVITFILYHVLVWIKSTRAWSLMKGIIVLLSFVLIAALFQMNTILWLAEKTLNVGIIALIVVFQPELRKALESLGRRNILKPFFLVDTSHKNEAKFSEKTKHDLVRACYEMGAAKTGALIVIENEESLDEYERTGIELDSVVSAQLLLNIFEKNTPLHDGAVIVHGDRITAATCYLPLSDSMIISKELGTRHRAALGVSETTDSFTIIVSEETGAVSVAKRGKLERDLKPDQLELALEQFRATQGPARPSATLTQKMKRRGKDASKSPKGPKENTNH